MKLTGNNLSFDDLTVEAHVLGVFDIKNQTTVFSLVFHADIFVEKAIESLFYFGGHSLGGSFVGEWHTIVRHARFFAPIPKGFLQ